MKYGDFFSGFGGTAVGARDAGLQLAFGVEYDPDLAAVYRRNLGDHIIVEDVTRLDVAQLLGVDVFHASPPCTNASVANANGGESPEDLAMAQAVVRYVAHHLPRIMTLENVYQYRNFESWHVIARGLLDAGYSYAFWHVNMADYGVPQSRKRMIVIARRDGVKPQLPDATHAENPQPGFLGMLRPWVSWYEAIEDILHTLPESQFAPWQLKRLPEELRTMLMPTVNADGTAHPRNAGEPEHTVQASGWKQMPRAWLVSNQKTEFGDGLTDGHEPALSITSQHGGRLRAWLCEASNASSGSDRWGDQPAQTITTPTGGRVQRAFIVDGKLGSYSTTLSVRDEKEPSFTQTTSHNYRDQRASVAGRVVKMTPRALARFQSFPDWYELPEHARTAVTGIGNAVPPLFARRLYESLKEQEA